MAHKQNDGNIQTLERGQIYFFYRPRVEEHDPHSTRDIQQLYMVLSPDGQKRYRLVILGRKKLPDPSQSGRGRFWGFIETVTSSPQSIERELEEQKYATKTRGERTRPAARPAGEGVYRILRHDDHTHLVYALELPRQPDEVQRELRIEEEASYIISIKNPEQGSPRAAGLSEEKQAAYPKILQKAFRDRKFVEADPPRFLDYEGTEFLLISASDDVSDELGVQLHTDREQETTADIFQDLKLDKDKHPLEPLFQGKWK